MADSNPFDLPEDWDNAEIAGVEIEGLVRVEGVSRPYKWDKKQGPGTSGATKTFRGEDDKPFKIVVTMWLAEQWDAWRELRNLVRPTGTKQALDFYHPTTDDVGIKSIVVEEISPPVHKGKGLWEAVIDASEYRPAPKANATGTPSGSKSNAAAGGKASGGEKAPTAQTEQEKEIARLYAIAREP